GARRIPGPWQPRFLEAAARARQCRGLAGGGLWRARRGIHPYRPGREPPAAAPGHTQHQGIPRRPQRYYRSPPRPADAGGEIKTATFDFAAADAYLPRRSRNPAMKIVNSLKTLKKRD